MKIQNKLFLILFGFSLLLVTSLVLLMQLSIDKGMVEYVNTKEIKLLQPITLELAEEYSQQKNWLGMVNQHDKFLRLIQKRLVNSELSVELVNLPIPLPIESDKLADSRSFRDHRPPGGGRPPRENRPPGDGRPSRENRPPRNGRPPHEDRLFGDGRPPPTNYEAHYALLDSNEKLIVGKYPKELEYSKTAILVNDEVVGFFAVSKRNQLTQGYEVDFINQQQNYLWIIALSALIFVALVTFPLAQHVVKPIKLITQGMHALTQGDYQQPIDLKRKDELGQLSRDYNDLALTLEENETARKRWLANISHELRTPVAILRGELEAMLDDVRPLNKNNITSANDEVKHLQRLIDDLHQLTSADIGGMHCRKEQENLTSLLNGELDKYRSYLADAGITLNSVIVEQEIPIYGDKTRLYQLFENIINNAVKYSKSTELTITLSINKTASKAEVIINFEDNGIGVEDKHLANLFEYLYRVDDSRNRQLGGAGLGLSICRQIVNAHQGEISAQQASLGGLAIIIKLPIS